jgi:hypothetical protein
MKPRRVSRYRAPRYPDRLELERIPGALAIRPRRWASPALAAAVTAALAAGFAGCKDTSPPAADPIVQAGQTVDPKTMNQLRTMGYVQGPTVNSEEDLPAPKLPPAAPAGPQK